MCYLCCLKIKSKFATWNSLVGYFCKFLHPSSGQYTNLNKLHYHVFKTLCIFVYLRLLREGLVPSNFLKTSVNWSILAKFAIYVHKSKIERKKHKTFEFYFSDQWRDSESKLMDMNTRHCVITLASVIILF